MSRTVIFAKKMPPKKNPFTDRDQRFSCQSQASQTPENPITKAHVATTSKASSEYVLKTLEDVILAGHNSGEIDPELLNPKPPTYRLLDEYETEEIELFYSDICAQLPGRGGSKQYSAEQKKVLVRAALKQYRDTHFDAVTIANIKTPYKFMLEIAPTLGVGQKNLASWVAEFVNTKDIADVARVRPSLLRIENARHLSIPHIVEVMTVILNRKKVGLSTSYKVLRAHLMSTRRENSLCQLDVLPPIDVSHDALRDAVTKIGGFGFGKVKAVGNINTKTEEDIVKRAYRIRVWIVEYYLAKRKEKMGLAVVFSMDESYFHVGHKNDYSILPRYDYGNLIPDINRPSESGERICMIGAIAIYMEPLNYIRQ